ncbi:MAG: hypothetical protein QM650_00450, partial [Microlunatus sp.]
MTSASHPTAARRLLAMVLAAVCLLAGALLGGVGRLAYADAPADAAAVTETVLKIPGTPEADGKPVTLDASLFTTKPGLAQPAIVLAHGFGGTKAD